MSETPRHVSLPGEEVSSPGEAKGGIEEKVSVVDETASKGLSAERAQRELQLTEDIYLAIQDAAEGLSIDETTAILTEAFPLHESDPNFPSNILEMMRQFLDEREVTEKPERHAELVQLMKLEAVLLSTNSPYAEVRAVVGNTDDPDIPCSTIRSWTIGIFFVACCALVDQLFSIRQPSISLNGTVVQLLSFPIGKAWERFLPDVGFTLFGVRHSLNPGPFSQKEHMLITIMANVGSTLPSSRYIIWSQYLKKYFNQSYAGQFGYQILLAISVDLSGYGLAGLVRKFLVYPTYCVYPTRLVTVAMNRSLHDDTNTSVLGPLKKTFTMSRFRFFMYAFVGMFIYFWFPNYIFTALSIFNWIAWIAPTNVNLTAITGIKKGLGFNPLPTFDWNMITADVEPLILPLQTVINRFVGVILGGILIIIFWYNNIFNTSYLPINSNALWTHNATSYDVSKVVDSRGWLDETKYQAYSPVYMAASNLVMYFFFFAVYAATVSYVFLNHRREISLGFKALFNGIKRKEVKYLDVHNRLMSKYGEVPEWLYLSINIAAVSLAVAALAGWQTYTNVGVVFFGILLAAVFLVPAGIIYATTGILIELNVLAEFLGGAIQPGNALMMNFFKCYGYATTAHAIAFSADLKLAHYLKIPPKHTFWAQIIATVVSAFLTTALLNFQMNQIPNVCDSNQVNRFTCPGVNTYFSAAVLFGSVGAKKVFGTGAQYTGLLTAFPIGFALPIVLYFIQKRFDRDHWVRKIHPVALLSGGMNWSPYNFAYMWPAVPFAWLSMGYLKKRYLAFWSKYNYVTSAAFTAGIAIAGLIIFFAVEYQGVELNWWGNTADSGCESTACVRLKLGKGEYFGPRIGTYA